jgi:hypothetical protein
MTAWRGGTRAVGEASMQDFGIGTRRRSGWLVLVLALAVAALGASCARETETAEPAAEEPAAEEPVADQPVGGPSRSVIVKFAEGLEVASDYTRFDVRPGTQTKLDAAAVTQAQDVLAQALRDARVEHVRRVFQEEGERFVDGRDTLLYYALTLAEGAGDADADRLAEALGSNPLVEEAHRQRIGRPAGLPKMTPP